MTDPHIPGNIALGVNAEDAHYEKLPSTLESRSALDRIMSDQMVMMRDGVRLATDVYLPTGNGPFPSILTRLPYGKTEPWTYLPVIAKFWVRREYAAVVQDVRGKWGSEGVFAANSGEQEDGYDTLAWISQQPWSNGKVGMWGESYYGFTSYAAAATQHPALACIAPGNISLDRYASTMRYGCLQLNTVGTWAIIMADQTYQELAEIDYWHLPLADLAKHAGVRSDYFERLIANPERSEFWEQRSVLSGYDNIQIPVLHLGGWYDNYLGPMIVDWQRMVQTNIEAQHQHLFIGPWDHNGSADSTGRVGKLPVAKGIAEARWDTIGAFFDHYLMGISNEFGQNGAVRYFVMGKDRWRDAPTWPPPQSRMTPIYLRSSGGAKTLKGDGRLTWHKPTTNETHDTYTYDPTDPVADTLAIDCWNISEEMGDRREVEEREDVLVYTSEPFAEGLELTGPILAKLYFASSAVDTDVTVALVDVDPTGHANLIQDGILRTRYRTGTEQPELMIPGEIYALEIDLWSSSYALGSGHRLRIEISSSCFNRYDRNLNTGDPLGIGDNPLTATQIVYHDAKRPSHVMLPIYME
ncbi:MAG: CocE/NonD family hydrolase [Chloroflexota bacterium]